MDLFYMSVKMVSFNLIVCKSIGIDNYVATKVSSLEAAINCYMCKSIVLLPFLAHLVYQPKSLIQSCFVCRWHQCHWHCWFLCTPPLATGLNMETSYLVHYVPKSLIYVHQIFSDSDSQFLNGSHFGILICYPIDMFRDFMLHILQLLLIFEDDTWFQPLNLCISSLPTYTKGIMPL